MSPVQTTLPPAPAPALPQDEMTDRVSIDGARNRLRVQLRILLAILVLA